MVGGLVFNPESNQCDYDSNVVGCEAREEVSCTGRKDGTYTIGCSSTFFFCSNGNLHLSTCQHGLFYDVVRNTCDHKWRIRACGGHPEVQREPVTRAPLLVPTYPPEVISRGRGRMWSHKVSGYGSLSSDLLSCEGKPDGSHSISGCAQQYVMCTDGVSQLAECPDEQVFSQGKCTPIEQVAECRSSEPASPIDCSIRDDGNYGLGCTSNFIFCSGGIAMPMVSF
ncbi:chitin binding Peritrophin-A domain protein [Ancylostoma caninum]|uniref:Chitin binding Peritrophin-A domain protein n=1 Tax=Ancylostoma caninum TaxID=29170 RepID=A0A368F8G3_ANCCA|nr:chitin binding Peritrophin-A domain protein [Ancylostoma caninum]